MGREGCARFLYVLFSGAFPGRGSSRACFRRGIQSQRTIAVSGNRFARGVFGEARHVRSAPFGRAFCVAFSVRLTRFRAASLRVTYLLCGAPFWACFARNVRLMRSAAHRVPILNPASGTPALPYFTLGRLGARGWRGVPPPPTRFFELLVTTFRLSMSAFISLA